MPDTPEAVLEALRENNDRPFGRPRTVRAEELVEAAEQLADTGLLVTALFELMSAYTYAGEDRKSPVVFARIAQLWDSRPEDFSAWEEHQFYWRYKWVTTALLQVPEVPLAAVERWTGEMRDRYRKAGHGMQPVYAMRHRIAEHTGAGTDLAYDLWVTRQRTDLSDCEACETRYQALHHVAAGDDLRALEIWEPVLTGQQTCMEEPYASMAYALLPLLRTGRLDAARSYHLSGYRFARGKGDMAAVVGRHLEFCALTRNEGRGLEVLAENRGMFEGAGAPLDRLGFLIGVEVLLGRLAVLGHEELAVPGPPGRHWTVDALLARVRADASALAAAFDARNGTPAVGERRLARLRVGPLVAEPLPLGIRARAVEAAPSAAFEPAGTAPDAGAAADPEIPADFAELLTRARELSEIGRPDADTFWERVRAHHDAAHYTHDERVGPDVLLRAELAEQRAFDGFDREEWEQARRVMLEAAGLFEQAGLPGRASAARARAATALFAANELDPAMDCSGARAELEAEVRLAEKLWEADEGASAGRESAGAAADQHVGAWGGTGNGGATGRAAEGSPGAGPRIGADRYLAVLQCAAMATRHALLAELPEPSEAARADFDASIDRLRREAERLGSPARGSAARQYAADVAARGGRFEEAGEELAAALALIETARQPWRSPRPLALLAQIKVQSGQAAEAVPLIHQALAAAARWPDASLSLGPFHALLGHACAHSGDHPAAIRYLAQAADRLDREGSDEHAAQVRLELADLLAREGRQADSVAVLESVVLGETGGFEPRLLAQVRLNLARGLAALGEQRAAAEEFLGLADAVAEWTDEQFTHTLVACEAAVALAKAGLWEAARTAYARAVACHAKAPRPAPTAAMMREFARLTMAEREAEGLESALTHLAEADEVCAQVPVDVEDFVLWYETGANHYQRGRAYASAQAFPDGLAAMERAIAAYESGGHAGEEPRAEAVRIAALIEGNALGAVDAATARLDAAIARCASAGFPAAAATLASVRSGIAER